MATMCTHNRDNGDAARLLPSHCHLAHFLQLQTPKIKTHSTSSPSPIFWHLI